MLVVVGGTVNRMLIAKGCSIKGETFECFWGCFFCLPLHEQLTTPR